MNTTIQEFRRFGRGAVTQTASKIVRKGAYARPVSQHLFHAGTRNSACRCNFFFRRAALACRLLSVVEAPMNDSQHSETDRRVEVSGWDAEEKFFVERADLARGADGKRFVYLRRPLRAGLIVFLRVLDTRVGYPTFPVAYHVIEVAAGEKSGASRVTLERLQERRGGLLRPPDSQDPVKSD